MTFARMKNGEEEEEEEANQPASQPNRLFLFIIILTKKE